MGAFLAMWMLLVNVGILLIGQIASWLTPQKTNRPKPLTKDNINLPRTEEGSTVPIVFGRVRLTSPILAWSGPLHTLSVTDPVNGAQFITYGLDMLFIAGLPMGAGITRANETQQGAPKLYQVWLGDKSLEGQSQDNRSVILPHVGQGAVVRIQGVMKQNYFGGNGNGGGLIGAYQFFGGFTDNDFTSPGSPIGDAMIASAQSINGQASVHTPGGVTSIGGVPLIPGHRKLMCVAFTDLPSSDGSSPYRNNTVYDQDGTTQATVWVRPGGFMLGESPSIDGLSFEISSYGDALFSMANPGFDFGSDADPAECIYDLLTNQWGRLGIDPAKIDLTSFAAVSATLLAENHGYSNAHYDTQTGADVIAEILKQINGVLYEEPTTGLMTLKLIRFDYDPAAIPSFDPSTIIAVESYTMGTWTNTVNEVRVTYTSRLAQYASATAVAQSLANAVGNNNRRRSKTIDYPGITNATLAGQVAARDLNILSQPFGQISLALNRTAQRLRPGMTFKVTFPEYNLNAVIFRAQRVDVGQLFDNKIIVDAIQDAFSTAYQGLGRAWPGTFANFIPYPLTPRIVTEAPRWLARQAADAGILTDADVTHLLPLLRPSTLATQWLLKTKQAFPNQGKGGASLPLHYFWLMDIAAQAFTTTFTVSALYSGTLAPYDTSIGLTVQGVSGPLAATFATLSVVRADIADHGSTLCCVVDPTTGEMEFLAFESVTDLGGGSYRFNAVWRGLLDTPPRDLPAGASGFFVNANMVSRRGWSTNKPIDLWVEPVGVHNVGSGGDPQDSYTPSGYFLNSGAVVSGRAVRPLPMANMLIGGEMVVGSASAPAVAGLYNYVTLLEEGFDVYGKARDRAKPLIARGDDGADTLNDFSSTTFYADAVPHGKTNAFANDGSALQVSANFGAIGSSAITVPAGAITAQVQVDGYGDLDLMIESQKVFVAGDPLIGKGGVQLGDVVYAWRNPTVRAFAPSWRNLLANTRWNNGGGTTGAWSNTAIVVNSGSFSLLKASTFYAQPSAAAASLRQAARVTQWNPRGLTAVGVGYFRNANSDANDTGTLSVEANKLPPIQTLLASASTGAIAMPTANWSRQTTQVTIPALTGSVALKASMAEVTTGGTTNADTCFSDGELRVGQFATINGLTNYSFETSTTAGWTVSAGAFSVNNFGGGPSTWSATGGAFSTNTMFQELALPAGFEFGSHAFVTAFAASGFANDTFEMRIDAMDASSTVLATGTTGAANFNAALGPYSKKLAYVVVPDGATKIRVTVTATRALGTGSSGITFDEVVLWVGKDLAPRTSKTLDFSAPAVQRTPTTWQEFVLAYPALPVPTIVLGGTDFGGLELGWTDQTTHPTGKLCGQFGAGVASIAAYQFARGTGAAATHLAASGPSRGTVGNYTLASAFTVAVAFRVDEFSFSTACGLVGRMDLTAGWGLELTAAGQVQALLRGPSGTSKSVATGRAVADRALHWAFLVNDPVAQTLSVYDEQGLGGSVSTASGLNEISRTATTCHLRVGRDADDRDVLPGQIGRVYVFESALTAPQIAAIATYGLDPTGAGVTSTRAAAAVCSGPADSGGATAFVAGAAQVAIAYDADLTSDGGTGYGLPVSLAIANLIPSWDLTNGTFWPVVGTTVLTQGIVDATGLPRGVNVAATASGHGIRCLSIPLAASPGNTTLVLWLRQNSGSSINIQLTDSASIIEATVNASPTIGVWTKYELALAGWTGSTATANVYLVSNSGAVNFDLAHTVCLTQGADIPVLLPLPATTLAAFGATAALALSLQANHEGELVAHGIGTGAATPAAGSLINLTNGANSNDRKELLQLAAGGGFRAAVYDGAAAVTNGTAAYTPSSATPWEARARWNRASIPDPSAPFSEVALTDAVSAGTYTYGIGRTAVWTPSAVALTTLQLGVGAAPPSPTLLRSVTVQTREAKLV